VVDGIGNLPAPFTLAFICTILPVQLDRRYSVHERSLYRQATGSCNMEHASRPPCICAGRGKVSKLLCALWYVLFPAIWVWQSIRIYVLYGRLHNQRVRALLAAAR
jgi:hypothetical protein